MQVINAVVIQLSNMQRNKHPDMGHEIWYFPTHVSVSIMSIDFCFFTLTCCSKIDYIKYILRTIFFSRG